VRITGADVTALAAPHLARRVAYLAQSVDAAFAFTVTDMVATGRTPYVRFGATPTQADLRRAAQAMAWAGITHLAERAFNTLSGGERQLCGIARALAQDTPVIVLDEPTSALDYGNQVQVLQIVRDLARSGKTVLMTSHAPNQALEVAGSVLLLQAGEVMAHGDPNVVINGPALSSLYGVPIDVGRVDTPYGPRSVCIPQMDRVPLTAPPTSGGEQP